MFPPYCGRQLKLLGTVSRLCYAKARAKFPQARAVSRQSGRFTRPLRGKFRTRPAIGKYMKKSKHLSLVLMGTLALAGCGSGSQENPQVFKDKMECVASGKFNEEQCAKMEADARAQTPQFASREECVKQFGESTCKQESTGNGNFWMPMLMGFVAGQMLGGTNTTPAQGLYQNPDGKGFKTAKGAQVAKNPGSLGKSGASKTSPLGRAVSRGGFSSGGRAIGS